MRFTQFCPFASLQSSLFQQFAFGGGQRFFTRGTSAFRDFPGVLIKRITVLADKLNTAVVVDRNYADRDVLKMNDAVNAFLPIRTNDLIFSNADPGIVVNH